jgi:chlorobactene glucosyltransferase
VSGSGPQQGWLGKNFACHSLSLGANGDYFLFLDADVRVDPNLIRDSVPFLERHRLDLLSIFPVQEMKSLGEWLTVPWMNRILLGNLPLILIRMVRLTDFSAANGQFMLFRASAYREHCFHAQVKQEKVEDIRIMRLMKRSGMRTHTLLSNGQITCRMYRGFGGALSGFAKNVHAFFGKNWLILALYVFLTLTGPFAVLLSFPLPVFFICLGGMLLFAALVARMSRQNIFLSLVLLPIQMASLLAIALMAAYRQMTGQLYWKGRRIG